MGSKARWAPPRTVTTALLLVLVAGSAPAAHGEPAATLDWQRHRELRISGTLTGACSYGLSDHLRAVGEPCTADAVASFPFRLRAHRNTSSVQVRIDAATPQAGLGIRLVSSTGAVISEASGITIGGSGVAAGPRQELVVDGRSSGSYRVVVFVRAGTTAFDGVIRIR